MLRQLCQFGYQYCEPVDLQLIIAGLEITMLLLSDVDLIMILP